MGRRTSACAMVESVRQAVEAIPRRSVLRHAHALHMSDRTVSRFNHFHPNFYSYKIMVVQELKEN